MRNRPKPKFLMTWKQHDQLDLFMETMVKLDLAEVHDREAIRGIPSKPGRWTDSDWKKEERMKSMPWLQKNKKNKKFYS